MDEEEQPELTPWERHVAEALEAAALPMWEYKARAATYSLGHRGILDLDLDFPEEYLKGPAPICYVWKTEVEDGTRVHAYAHVEGGCFHLEWDGGGEPGAVPRPQNQPEHKDGACGQDACLACKAARLLADFDEASPDSKPPG